MNTKTLTLEYQADQPMFPSNRIRLSDTIVHPVKRAIDDLLQRGFATLIDPDEVYPNSEEEPAS